MPIMTRRPRVLAAILGAVGLAALFLVLAQTAHAGALSSVSLTMSDSRPGATASSHQFGFTPAEATQTIMGLKLEYCTSAAGTCTLPTGLDTTSAALRANLLDDSTTNPFAGWTLDSTTNGALDVTDSTGVSGASAQTIAVSGITNPGAEADTTATIFYVRVTTYSATALTSDNEIDDGALAGAVVPPVTVTARQDAMLNLTVAAVTDSTEIGTGQETTGASTPTALSFGIFKPLGTSDAESLFLAHDLTVSTNTARGYSVSVVGGAANAMTLSDESSSIAYVTGGTTWDDDATTGFGVTARAGGAPATFSDGLSYFPAPAGNPLVVAEHAMPISGHATMVAYRVQVQSTLPQGDYSGTLTYTLVPNF